MVVGSCSKGAGRGRGPSWLQLERTVLTGDAMVWPGPSKYPPPWGSLSTSGRPSRKVHQQLPAELDMVTF